MHPPIPHHGSGQSNSPGNESGQSSDDHFHHPCQHHRSQDPPFPDWYRVLHLPSFDSHLSSETIKAAYLSQRAIHDPNRFERGTRDRAKAEAYSSIIQEAFEVLRNKESRMRYDTMRKQVHNSSEQDRVLDRSRVLAEGWLSRIESETRAEEEEATAKLAKKRLQHFFRTVARLKIRYPDLPPPSREQVQKFFETEANRRRSQLESDRSAHRAALEVMIRAEFERRANGMGAEERDVRWQRAREEFSRVSHERKKVDEEKSYQAWEKALETFFGNLIRTHQRHSPSIKPKLSELQSPLIQPSRSPAPPPPQPMPAPQSQSSPTDLPFKPRGER